MSENPRAWTTASIEAVAFDEKAGVDPTPGLVLVYARNPAELPSALALLADRTTIGRDPACSLPIFEPSVSRMHIEILKRSDNTVLVRDLGSTNGTIVNGVRVQEAMLGEHDVIRVGDVVFRYTPRAALSYAAYGLDGSVAPTVAPVRHTITSPYLVGGYQIARVLERIERIATAGLTVIINGETGTGKELAAREVHRAGGRRGAFSAINCAALPPHLVESELFGYRKGAFTGANENKVGLVRAAHHGTLFLDEIGDMPLEAQAKLLRVLQEREVLPVGATTPEPVDVHVVCATHRDLDHYVQEGRFRGDLLSRLRGAVVRLPPLRERREDLVPLVRCFVEKLVRGPMRPSAPFMIALSHYAFPYNVRELESAVRHAVALADGDTLEPNHLPDAIKTAVNTPMTRPSMPTPSPAEPARPAQSFVRNAPTEEELRELLRRHGGNIAAVGRELGKERMQIHRWLKKFGIEIDEFR